MDASSDSLSQVELLAEEFLARQQHGERPTIEEYCTRFPELADEIRDLFEGFLLIENLKPGTEDRSRTFSSQRILDGKILDRVGDYRIIRELGRGGMGVVYEAEQESLRRRVALKVLPRQHAANKTALERFQREARAAAKMHHTNIVPVFDVDQTDEWVFYAMQLIQGQGLDLVIEDLKQLRAEKSKSGTRTDSELKASQEHPESRSIAASLIAGSFQQENLVENGEGLPPGMPAVQLATDEEALKAYAETLDAEGGSTISAVLPGQSEISNAETNRKGYFDSVAQIGLQAASALSYAHVRGIIHRDIKPSNLLLDAAGTIWVTDFGLAKTSDEAMTHTGDILGTIRYMSPERFNGQCDVRADIYSLGLTLYEMLVLKPAFASSDRLKLIELVHNTEPEHPRAIDPGIPRDLETIVLKCIDKDPRRRYQFADELAEDLQRFVDDEPIKARRISLAERAARWGRRNKGLATAVIAIASLLLVINIVGPLMHLRLMQAFKDKEAAEIKASREAAKNLQLAKNQEGLAREKTALADDLKRALFDSGLATERVEQTLIAMSVERGLLAAERSEYSQAVVWFARAAELSPPDSPARQDNLIRVQQFLPFATRPVRVFAHPSEWVEELSFDATGRYLLTYSIARLENRDTGRPARPGSCRLWDVERGEPLSLPDYSGMLTCAAWDHHGRLVALGTSEGRVLLWDLQLRKVRRTLDYEESIGDLQFSEDDRLLAIASGRKALAWSLDQETEVLPPRQHPEEITSVAISERGEQLASIAQDGLMRVFDCSAETDQSIIPPLRVYLKSTLAWTPVLRPRAQFVQDGRGLIYPSSSEGLRYLDLDQRQAYSAQPALENPSGNVEGFALLQQEPIAVAAYGWGDNYLQVFRAGEEAATMDVQHRANQPVYSAAFSVDGTELLTVGGDRYLKSWDIARGRAGPFSLEHAAAVSALSISPQGHRFATAQQGGLVIVWQRPVLREGASDLVSVQTDHVGGTLVCVSSDQRFFAPTGRTNSQKTQVFDAMSRTPVGLSVTAAGLIVDSHFSLDGQELFTLAQTGIRAGRLQIWHWLSGKMLAEVQLESQPRSLDVSADGQDVAVLCTDGIVRIYDSQTARHKRQWQAVEPFSFSNWYVYNGALRYAPREHRLVTWNTDHVARVWNSATGKLEWEIEHDSLTRNIAFSPDERYLATSSGSESVSSDRSNLNAVYVTDLETGNRVAGPLTHPDWSFGVAFSPDGNRLLSTCRDGSVRIWNWRDGTPALSVLKHDHEVHGADFSPDGRHIVSVSDDKLLHLWSAADGKPVMPPRRIATTGWSFGWAGTSVIIAGKQPTLEVFDLQGLSAWDDHPVADVVRFAELLSCRRVVEGGESLLTSDELLPRYRSSRATLPEAFELDFSSAASGRIADQAPATSLAAALVRHWKPEPMVVPRQVLSTGLAEFRRGNWSEASRYFLSNNPSTTIEEYLLALILVDNGLQDEYTALCQAQLKEIPSENSTYLNAIQAQLLLLTPDAVQDYQLVRGLCGRAPNSQADVSSGYAYISQLARALLSLREGEFDAAVDWSRRTQEGGRDLRATDVIVAMVIEGLAQRALGHEAEAEAQLSRARELFATEQASFAQTDSVSRPTFLLSRILLREAGLKPDEPEDADTLMHCGRLHLMFGHFSSAADYLRRSFDLNPGNHDLLYHRTFLLTVLGNDEELAAARRRLIDGWGATEVPILAERTAKAYLLSPHPGPDLARACQLADFSVERGAGLAVERYFWHAKALADFRRREFKSCLAWSRRVNDLQLSAEKDPLATASRLLTAMTQQQLGQPEVAREQLKQARMEFQARLKVNPNVNSTIWRHDDLWCLALEREAVELIGEAK